MPRYEVSPVQGINANPPSFFGRPAWTRGQEQKKEEVVSYAEQRQRKLGFWGGVGGREGEECQGAP
jgi:hypothetical protein